MVAGWLLLDGFRPGIKVNEDYHAQKDDPKHRKSNSEGLWTENHFIKFSVMFSGIFQSILLTSEGPKILKNKHDTLYTVNPFP